MIIITGYTHFATGLLAGATLYQFGADTGLVFGTIIGSLLPDIDHPESKMGRHIPIVPHMMYLVAGHRGITHSLIFVIILLTLGFFWMPFFGLAIGSVIHIVGDMLTPSGVPFFWPKKQRYRIAKIRTGSVFDILIGMTASFLTVIMFIKR